MQGLVRSPSSRKLLLLNPEGYQVPARPPTTWDPSPVIVFFHQHLLP